MHWALAQEPSAQLVQATGQLSWSGRSDATSSPCIRSVPWQSPQGWPFACGLLALQLTAFAVSSWKERREGKEKKGRKGEVRTWEDEGWLENKAQLSVAFLATSAWAVVRRWVCFLSWLGEVGLGTLSGHFTVWGRRGCIDNLPGYQIHGEPKEGYEICGATQEMPSIYNRPCSCVLGEVQSNPIPMGWGLVDTL